MSEPVRHGADGSGRADAPEDFEAWAARRLRTVAPGPPVGATIGWWRRHTLHDEHAWLLALAVELRDEIARQTVTVGLTGLLDATRVATPAHEISRRLRCLADEIDFPDPREVTSCPSTPPKLPAPISA